MGKLFRRLVVLGICAAGASYAYSNILNDSQKRMVDSGVKIGKKLVSEGIQVVKKELNKLSGEEELSTEGNNAWVEQQWSEIGF